MVLDGKLTKGDWIVHARYGLGQVLGEDRKVLAGEARDYYRVQTRSATYWLPKNRVNADAVRSIASERKFRQALAEIRKQPTTMSTDFRTRRATIAEIIATNSVTAFATLIRDLYYRRKVKHLNESEKFAFETLKARFSREWSVSSGLEEEVALARLEKTLSGMMLEPMEA